MRASFFFWFPALSQNISNVEEAQIFEAEIQIKIQQEPPLTFIKKKTVLNSRIAYNISKLS